MAQQNYGPALRQQPSNYGPSPQAPQQQDNFLSRLPPQLRQQAMQNPQVLAQMKQEYQIDPAAFEEKLAQMTKDFSGDISGAKSQLAQANALRKTATPQGRQAGKLFVAANPLEHIGAGMSKYAGQRDSKLAQEALTDATNKQGASVLQRTLDAQAAKELQLDEQRQFQVLQGQNKVKAQQEAAELLAATKAGERKTEPYWSEDEGIVVNLNVGPDGKHYDAQGNEYPYQNLTPYKASQTTGSKQNLKAVNKALDAEAEADDFAAKSDRMLNIFTSPYLAGAVGSKTDITKNLPDYLNINPETGSLRTELASLTMEQIIEPLKLLGPRPTDADLAQALKTARTADMSSPTSYYNYLNDTWGPAVSKAIQNGTLPESEKPAALAAWDIALNEAKATMLENIETEEGKSATQKGKESLDEKEVILYRARQKAPEGVNAEQWKGLSDEDKDYYLKNMVD